MQVLSLGSSCDAANQLKKHKKQNENNFFDFLWNELDGLQIVQKVIEDDFQHFLKLENYIKTDHIILTPLLKSTFNINLFYPNLAFMHNDIINETAIDSFSRKIKRTREILQSKEKKVFLYYRHYHHTITNIHDINILIKETQNFANMYKEKFNNNFVIVSLIIVAPMFRKDELEKYLIILKEFSNEHIQFDYAYRRNDSNVELNDIANKRWTEILDKYLCSTATASDVAVEKSLRDAPATETDKAATGELITRVEGLLRYVLEHKN